MQTPTRIFIQEVHISGVEEAIKNEQENVSGRMSGTELNPRNALDIQFLFLKRRPQYAPSALANRFFWSPYVRGTASLPPSRLHLGCTLHNFLKYSIRKRQNRLRVLTEGDVKYSEKYPAVSDPCGRARRKSVLPRHPAPSYPVGQL